jgi:hypothetical protein
MVQKKILQLNNIQTHVRKIADLISFYETQAKASDDTICGSFLKNIADKKSIQLIIIEKIMRKRGVEILPFERNNRNKNYFSVENFSQTSLEDLYDFISKQSLKDMKELFFLSQENPVMRPVLMAMGELEEDFLLFVEGDFLRHLSETGRRSVLLASQSENSLLASAI